jgi:hypothetical protein
LRGRDVAAGVNVIALTRSRSTCRYSDEGVGAMTSVWVKLDPVFANLRYDELAAMHCLPGRSGVNIPARAGSPIATALPNTVTGGGWFL